MVEEVRGLTGQGVTRRSAVAAGRLDDRVVLGRHQDLGRLLGNLARRAVDARREQPGGVRALRPTRSPVGDRRPEVLEPGEPLGRAGPGCHRVAPGEPFGGPVEVEAAPLPAVAGRPARHDPGQERITVTVEGEVHEPQDVAARLALAPQGRARAREEVDVARRERRRDRLLVGPGEHQDPAIVGILHHDGHEPVAAVAGVAVVAQRTGRGGQGGTVHATASGIVRGPGCRRRPSPP